MKFIVKAVYTCPEGAVESTKLLLCEGDQELNDILSFNNTDLNGYASYSLLGVCQPLSRYELKKLEDFKEGNV